MEKWRVKMVELAEMAKLTGIGHCLNLLTIGNSLLTMWEKKKCYDIGFCGLELKY